MSITFDIATYSDEEYRALQSEGAPSVNFSNSNAFAVAALLGLSDFDYVGTIDPDDILYPMDDAISRAQSDDMIRRLTALREVAQVAKNLGREVGWG